MASSPSPEELRSIGRKNIIQAVRRRMERKRCCSWRTLAKTTDKSWTIPARKKSAFVVKALEVLASLFNYTAKLEENQVPCVPETP